MKLAIMQPYFFPYIGYFSLIKNTDKFISFDPVQYIKKGWMNRNRILKPNEGWQYIIAPVKTHGRDTLIKDIQVIDGDEWKSKIINQLDHYKKRAPYYNEVIRVLEACFNHSDTSLSKLNSLYLSLICSYLNIPFNFQMYSDLDIDVSSSVTAADEWALRISESLAASEYVNPPGGVSFFNKKKYSDSNIKLKFLKIKDVTYSQRRNQFEPGLSIVDVMMFNSPEEIVKMLDQYEYL